MDDEPRACMRPIDNIVYEKLNNIVSWNQTIYDIMPNSTNKQEARLESLLGRSPIQ